MDLIDRQAAIDVAIEAVDSWDGMTSIGRQKRIEKYINALPSAGPKKGKWIPHREKSREYIGTALVNIEYDYWFCDTCGYRVENGQPIYNFCPHCGVDMRSEQDE